jgi:hypothetical protein
LAAVRGNALDQGDLLLGELDGPPRDNVPGVVGITALRERRSGEKGNGHDRQNERATRDALQTAGYRLFTFHLVNLQLSTFNLKRSLSRGRALGELDELLELRVQEKILVVDGVWHGVL